MNKEEWKDIKGYEGLYQISTHGKIRSLGRYIKSKNNSERFIKGRILKFFRDKQGYLKKDISKNGKKETCRVHRLVLTAFDRPPKPGEQCNHKDGNKQNNDILNLEWVTAYENERHSIEVLGKSNEGEKSGRTELINDKVKKIKILLKEEKLLQKEIAELCNVSEAIINQIKQGKTWKHIKI